VALALVLALALRLAWGPSSPHWHVRK